MDINVLKMFLKISNGATFSEVAEDENMSQSALSKAIQRLEDELNVKLFDRTYRSVILTSAGVQFRNDMRRLLPEFDKAVSSVRAVSNKATVRCAIIPSLTVWHMHTCISQFKEIFSDIYLEISDIGDPSLTLSALRKGTIDVVIMNMPVPEELYNITHLHDDRIVAVFPKDHRFANKKELTLDELEGEPILLASNAPSTVHSLQSIPSFQPILDNMVEMSPRRETAIAKVISGEGIGLFHEGIMLNRVMDDVAFAPIICSSPTYLAAITPKNRPVSNETELFINFMHDALNSLKL